MVYQLQCNTIILSFPALFLSRSIFFAFVMNATNVCIYEARLFFFFFSNVFMALFLAELCDMIPIDNPWYSTQPWKKL